MHFRALGVDAQNDDITVAGIGDMSGDVFGNGMLLSQHLRLVAAFDHRHVFLDPDPDPERSHAERRACSRSHARRGTTTTARCSPRVAGVYPRSLKAVPISEPMQARLGITASSSTTGRADLGDLARRSTSSGTAGSAPT